MNDFEIARQLFGEGLDALGTNDLPTAEMRFARSLELLPDRVSTLNNLAAIKLKLRKFDQAEELARKAVVQEPNSPEAWSNLGLALTATGRQEEEIGRASCRERV